MFGKPAATTASHFPKLDIAVGTRGVWETPMLMQTYSVLELDIMNDRPVKPNPVPIVLPSPPPTASIPSTTCKHSRCSLRSRVTPSQDGFTYYSPENGGFVAVPSQATISSASLLNVQQEPPLQFLMYSSHNGQFSQAQFQSAPNQVLPTPPYTQFAAPTVKDTSDATGTKEKTSNTTSARPPARTQPAQRSPART
ncbi:hypothetical protein A0H81_03092 [Grifola frondosa]|uniref:Uncharacterized protein n=1 Tax=Grifola frondosa TaxID=5627 RepID=A0A1C7MJ38_GRIFR|nr:hypothetical protein A0H81_03092 [Grifola frondosa]